jgi:hypothetical protein
MVLPYHRVTAIISIKSPVLIGFADNHRSHRNEPFAIPRMALAVSAMTESLVPS